MRTPPDTERIDPRALRSRQRAIETALELLREHGVRGVTIEAVAANSGIAKTTLYRQFADREELFFAAIESVKNDEVIPVQHGVVVDIERWLVGFAKAVQHADFAALIPSIIEMAERSDRGRELAAEFGVRRRRALLERLRAAITAGELPRGFDVEVAVSQLVGPILYRRYLSRQPVGPAFARQLVRSVLSPAVAAASESRR